MSKNLYIDASHPSEVRVVLKSENHIEDYEYESVNNTLIKNNIYLGKVSRIEPSLQAAFVDFGRERHGFLSFNDIQSDYYQIPQNDLEKIKKEEEKAREELSKESENIENKILEGENNININDPVEKVEEIEEVGKKNFPKKRYKIQEVIKPNQVILVQVLKDERGFKGAALSTFISIAGKYIVLMPNTAKGGGISRKIFNPIERKKIRTILNEIEIPKEMGIIVRTAGLNKTKNEINNDLNNLISAWNIIKENAMSSIAPTLIHQESDIIKRSIRDMYDEETQSIIVEGNEGYQKTKKFIRDFYFPPHIFTEQESFEKQIPAKFSIICVTEISCHFMSKDNLENAYNRIPNLKGIANNLLFTGFVNISNRLESLLTLNPEKRYLKLLNENPKLLHEIPLKMIASYLGVTDVALSRIRSRISKHRIN